MCGFALKLRVAMMSPILRDRTPRKRVNFTLRRIRSCRKIRAPKKLSLRMIVLEAGLATAFTSPPAPVANQNYFVDTLQAPRYPRNITPKTIFHVIETESNLRGFPLRSVFSPNCTVTFLTLEQTRRQPILTPPPGVIRFCLSS